MRSIVDFPAMSGKFATELELLKAVWSLVAPGRCR
jgi:hypothetical protein